MVKKTGNTKVRKGKAIGITIAAILLVMVIGCGVYVNDYYPADSVAVAAMAGNETVRVEQVENMTVFSPETPSVGFLFYPGGKVEHTAYAPLMMALAEQDVLCVLVEMPFRLAVLDSNAADGIPQRFPEIDTWYIGGHSLGGSMAASYAGDNAEELEGLVLLAAYSTKDLTGTQLDVLSLYGSMDGVLNREKYESYRGNLPSTTTETVIEGGNHAFFGSYGPQDGDGEAAISAEEQVRITAERLLAFFEQR